MRLALLNDPDAAEPVAILSDITGPRSLRAALATIPPRVAGYYVAAELPDKTTGLRWWVLHPRRRTGGSDLQRVLMVQSGLSGATRAEHSSSEISDAILRQIDYVRAISGATEFATDWSDQ